MSDAINPDHYSQGSIECIDAMQIVLTPEEFRGYLKGNVFKYLWREKDKNGNEDLRKGKSYYDSLIELVDASEAEQLATGEVKPPDGWRWLEVAEVIRKGDKPKNGDAVPLLWIGTPCCGKEFILRRNRFEVGEKVVHGDCKSLSISVVENILGDGWVDLVRDGVSTAYHVKDLAPYIEDAT